MVRWLACVCDSTFVAGVRIVQFIHFSLDYTWELVNAIVSRGQVTVNRKRRAGLRVEDADTGRRERRGVRGTGRGVERRGIWHR